MHKIITSPAIPIGPQDNRGNPHSKKYGGVRPTLVPVGVDQDTHIRLSRDIAQAHRLYNVTLTKDNTIGIFVKTDKDFEKLLYNAEEILALLNFNQLKRITDYKAIYINEAKI